jgi:DNA-binding transcriptional LysR family regulator
MPNVNLKLLQTFILVAEEMSFKVASEKAFRSPSAISAQIKQLEKQLGVKLFHRTTRSVDLTEEGKHLLLCAQKALSEVEAGLRAIRETADILRGKVSLASSPTVAGSRLARVLSVFDKDYPGIAIFVRELTSEAFFDSIRNRKVDFGIGPVIDTSEFRFEPLIDDPLYALVPKRFISTARTTIPLATLTNMPLLVLNTATALRRMIESALSERNLTFDTRYEFTQAQTLISMASAGLGTAILPKIVLPIIPDPNVHVLRITDPSLVRQIAVITNPGQSLSPASERLVQLVREYLPPEGHNLINYH